MNKSAWLDVAEVLDALLMAFPALGLAKIVWAVDILLALDLPESPAPRPPLVAAALYCHDMPDYKDRKMGEEFTSTLDALEASAPRTLALEEKYRPQYLGLDLAPLEGVRRMLRIKPSPEVMDQLLVMETAGAQALNNLQD